MNLNYSKHGDSAADPGFQRSVRDKGGDPASYSSNFDKASGKITSKAFQNSEISPFLKWAGGKTQLLEQIKLNLPKNYRNYYEPFVGGGSVVLALAPQKAFINDKNKQLINLYRQLQTNPEAVIPKIKELDSIPATKELYLSLREKYNFKISQGEMDAECAALMIWINKHCFNGLYRVNARGLFNVPYNNKKSGKSIDENNAKKAAKYLQKSAYITCLDFEEACKGVEKGDFVYFDSPYLPESPTAYFTDYTAQGFSRKDHERLAALFRSLDKRGAKLMLSNNDVPMARSLYADYKIQSFEVKRMISRNATGRRGREVIITNY